MSQQKLLARVVDVLDANGIEYMLTGSVVSSSQGDPRSTHDIDLIVNLQPSAVRSLIEAFPAPNYYFDEMSLREAMERRDMANLMEVETGLKVDFWILKDEPFDRNRFAPVEVEPWRDFRFRLTPEDTILQKLRWAEMSGGSEKQFADAKGVYEVQFATLDLPYMDQWVQTLDVQALWDRLKAEAKP